MTLRLGRLRERDRAGRLVRPRRLRRGSADVPHPKSAIPPRSRCSSPCPTSRRPCGRTGSRGPRGSDRSCAATGRALRAAETGVGPQRGASRSPRRAGDHPAGALTRRRARWGPRIGPAAPCSRLSPTLAPFHGRMLPVGSSPAGRPAVELLSVRFERACARETTARPIRVGPSQVGSRLVANALRSASHPLCALLVALRRARSLRTARAPHRSGPVRHRRAAAPASPLPVGGCFDVRSGFAPGAVPRREARGLFPSRGVFRCRVEFNERSHG